MSRVKASRLSASGLVVDPSLLALVGHSTAAYTYGTLMPTTPTAWFNHLRRLLDNADPLNQMELLLVYDADCGPCTQLQADDQLP